MRTVRTTVVTLAVATGTILLSASAGYAQNLPWCLNFPPDIGGSSCIYYTYEQCMAARSGIGGFCDRNPFHDDRFKKRKRRRRDR